MIRNPILEFLMGIFWLLVIGAAIKEYLFISTPSLNFWVIYFILLVTWNYIGDIIKIIAPKRKLIESKCKHGIAGGETNELCSLCIIERKQKEKVKQEELKKQLIKSQVKEIHNQEILRLRNLKFKTKDFLYKLDPQAFETCVIEMYQSLGYTVQQTPFSNDRGKDGIAFKDNKKYLIECKRYNSVNKIGRPQLQKFFAAIYEEKAEKGFFVTTGAFASTAYEYAKSNKIELINGDKLVELMYLAYPSNEPQDKYTVLCENCGNQFSFDLNFGNESKKCTCGYDVTGNITLDDLLIYNTTIPKKNRYYNRRY